MERHGLLSHFGNTGLAGHGKTPKVYFLTRKGWEILLRESDIPQALIGDHRKIHVDAAWSPQMYHRLRTVDLMISAEIAVRNRSHLTTVQTFLEYRMVKRGGRIERETSDYVADAQTSENRIVPDAAIIIENIETKKRALFFLEMDMATERIVTSITRDKTITVRHKMSQYDRYLQSLRYRQTYAAYGDFGFFTMLFVTLSNERVENIGQSTHDLPRELAQYYRLTTYDKAMGDFLGQIWVSRSPSDTQFYPLVREAS
jgi:Replication-relaxation